MKIGSLLEHDEPQSRKDLLAWQEHIMDCLPSTFDVGLDHRKLDYKPEGFVITVTRNGKELFFVDTSRATNNALMATMRIYGEFIDPYTIPAVLYKEELKHALYLYDIARKIRNLNSAADIRIGRKNHKTFTITVAPKGQGGLSDYLSVEYKPDISTFYVKLQHGFSTKNIEQLASTTNETKAVDLADKLFKERIIKR